MKTRSGIKHRGQSLNTGLNSVVVTAPARLHLGFLDLNGELGRSFGSMGLAISGFRTRIRVSKATTPYVSGPDGERARRYLERLQVLLSLDEAHRVEIAEAIPDYSGLVPVRSLRSRLRRNPQAPPYAA
jgi:predicted sugar kinase